MNITDGIYISVLYRKDGNECLKRDNSEEKRIWRRATKTWPDFGFNPGGAKTVRKNILAVATSFYTKYSLKKTWDFLQL